MKAHLKDCPGTDGWVLHLDPENDNERMLVRIMWNTALQNGVKPSGCRLDGGPGYGHVEFYVWPTKDAP